MQLNLPHHTVITLVAPSCSGKSTVSKMIYNACKDEGIRCKVLATDEIRRDLLCAEPEANMRTFQAQLVSTPTFSLLFAQLEAHISFPVNTEVVIVDSTGLDQETRNTISDLCIKHNYTNIVLVLDPPEEQVIASMKANGLEYMIPIRKDQKSHMKDSQVKNFKQTVVIEQFVLDPNFELQINFVNQAMAKQVLIDYPCVFIGDPHERTQELKQLVFRIRQKNKTIPIYILGDFIDKGGDTKGMIDYLTDNPDLILVIGNHENYVYKCINNMLSNRDYADEAKHFTSVAVLEGDNEYINKFNMLYKRCMPFAMIRTEDVNAYFTHSPCLNKDLGKFTKKSLVAQMKQRFSWDHSVIDQLEYLHEEADKNHPLHVFGHVTIDAFSARIKNKYAIDNGAAYGGCLTAFLIDSEGKHQLIHQDSLLKKEKELLCFPKRAYVALGS